MIIKKHNQKLGSGKKIKQEVQKQEAPIVHDLKEAVSEETVVVNQEIQSEQEVIEEETVVKTSVPKEPEFDLFDIESIDFTQRQERRRGSRRRRYPC